MALLSSDPKPASSSFRNSSQCRAERGSTAAQRCCLSLPCIAIYCGSWKMRALGRKTTVPSSGPFSKPRADLPVVFALLPFCLRPILVDQKPHTLIVRRVQPQHSVEDAARLFEPPKTPKIQTVPVHAPEERSIVDPAPRQHEARKTGSPPNRAVVLDYCPQNGPPESRHPGIGRTCPCQKGANRRSSAPDGLGALW